MVGDREMLAVPLGTLARPGSAFDDPASFRALADAQPGGSDPVARLADMDAEGIDQAVLYPSIGLYFCGCRGPGGGRRAGRAPTTTGWPAYCAADPRRLFGAAMLPLQDPAAAATSCGGPSPSWGSGRASCGPTPAWAARCPTAPTTSVWEAAEELGVPIGIHEGSSVIVPDPGVGPALQPADPPRRVALPSRQMLACAQLMAFGTLERHPGLRCSSSSPRGGWAPFWLERLDEQAESFGGFCPDMALRPSEYFARQCAISFEVDERTLPALAPFVGRRPHRVGQRLPAPRRHLPRRRRRHAGDHGALPDRPPRSSVLGLNARRLYGLPSRYEAWPG